jgi:quercetin dioxygenase-like cupin family protein
MALPHAAAGQVVDILGSKAATTESFALFKTDAIEVMRLVLPAGKRIPPHRVAGEITVQCLEGRLEFTAEDQAHAMRVGQLLHLSGGTTYSLLALEDAAALVTLVLRR